MPAHTALQALNPTKDELRHSRKEVRRSTSIKHQLFSLAVIAVIFGVAIIITSSFYPIYFSFVPTNLRRVATMAIGFTPLTKTPHQYLELTAIYSQKMYRYQEGLFVETFLHKPNESEAGNNFQGLRLDGAIDLTDKNPLLEHDLSFLSDIPGTAHYQVEGKIALSDAKGYVKLNEVPEPLKPYLNQPPETDVWYDLGVDGSGLSEAVNRFAPNRLLAGILGLVLEDQQVEISDLGAEDLDQVPARHLRLASPSTYTARFLTDSYKTLIKASDQPLEPEQYSYIRNLAQNIETLQLDTWIDPDKYHPLRTSLTISFRNPTVIQTASSVKLAEEVSKIPLSKLVIGWDSKLVNQFTEIIPPADAQPGDSLLAKYAPESEPTGRQDKALEAELRQVGVALEASYLINGSKYPDDLDRLSREGFLSNLPGVLADRENYQYFYNDRKAIIVVRKRYSSNEEPVLWSYQSGRNQFTEITTDDYWRIAAEFEIAPTLIKREE